MKKTLTLLTTLLAIGMLAGCGDEPTPVHEHSYDLDHWEISKTHHWHESNCEHHGLACDLAEHTYNSDGVCTECGYIKELETFEFIFNSDYCELNNEDLYQEGQTVELSLTLKEAYKDTLTVPSEIQVYSNGKLLTKGNEYTYVINDNVGKLSLKVTGTIVVQAFRNNDENAFKVNEEEFEYAINASNFDYLNYEAYYVSYSSVSMVIFDALVNYCPNVVYRSGAVLTTIARSSNLSYEYSYVEKEDSNYTEYNYVPETDSWAKSESDEQTFNEHKQVSLSRLPLFVGSYELTYNVIKDHYNEVTNAYEIEFTVNNYNVECRVSFYEGKIINVAYSDDSASGFFANIDISYIENDIKIPEDVKPHVHTFSSDWSSDETHHWHAATCEHVDEKSEYGEHTFDAFGKCTVCGYQVAVTVPVITKMTQTSVFSETPMIIEREWASDYSNVVSTDNMVSVSEYLTFDSHGYTIEEGRVTGEETTKDISYTYEDGVKTSMIRYRDGEVFEKEVYTYDELTGKQTLIEVFSVNGEEEKLINKTEFVYSNDYRAEITRRYFDGVQSEYSERKWDISETSGGGRKETYYVRYSESAEYKKIGYVIYNSLNQIIETQDTNYISQRTYFSYEYVTYTEDGELESITVEDEEGYKDKKVYYYDENGFIVERREYGYNAATGEYDFLNAYTKYETDEYGTVTKRTLIDVGGYPEKVRTVTEYEISYLPVDFHISYYDYLSETKGTYNSFELGLLPILG